jgi:hypothetical protein
MAATIGVWDKHKALEAAQKWLTGRSKAARGKGLEARSSGRLTLTITVDRTVVMTGNQVI